MCSSCYSPTVSYMSPLSGLEKYLHEGLKEGGGPHNLQFIGLLNTVIRSDSNFMCSYNETVMTNKKLSPS